MNIDKKNEFPEKDDGENTPDLNYEYLFSLLENIRSDISDQILNKKIDQSEIDTNLLSYLKNHTLSKDELIHFMGHHSALSQETREAFLNGEIPNTSIDVLLGIILDHPEDLDFLRKVLTHKLMTNEALHDLLSYGQLNNKQYTVIKETFSFETLYSFIEKKKFPREKYILLIKSDNVFTNPEQVCLVELYMSSRHLTRKEFDDFIRESAIILNMTQKLYLEKLFISLNPDNK